MQDRAGQDTGGQGSAVQGKGREGQIDSLLQDFCSLPVHIQIA